MTAPLRMARRFHPFPPQFRQPFRDTYVHETWVPPTFVAEYEPSWTTTTSPKTVSVTTDVGDVLVVNANCHTTETITAPTGGTGLTWTLQQSTVNVTNRRTMYAWTATATTAETFTMSVARTGALEWGFNCLRFSGSSGIGASAEADGGSSSTAPTFVAEYETVWNTTTTPKTASVTTAVGDVLVVFGMTADAVTVLNTPTGGTGLTWTLQQSITTGGTNCGVWVWTATATTAQTFTLSVARTGTTTWHWGFNCLRFSGSSGIGASNKASTTGSTAPSVSLTTTQDNSAVVVCNDDFDVGTGARTWRATAGAFTETTYQVVTSQHTVYGGYHANVGTAGANTYGLTAPNQQYSLVAVEVLGTTVPAAAPSVPITAMRDSSALVVNVADFAAADGASRAWLTDAGTFTETTYDRVVSKYTVYGGYHADPGSGGMYTVGLSAPAQTFTITAIEVLGASGTPPPAAAFPIVASTSFGSTGVGASSIVTAFPSDVTAGDLLLLFVTRLNAMTMTWPAGWTPLVTNTADDSAFEARYRIYQAGDTAPTVSGTASAYAYRMLRITGHDPNTAPEATTLVTGSSANPNPGSLDPTGWGAEDTLWVAAQSNGGTFAPTAYPTGYSNGTANAGSFGPAFAYATRDLNATSDDPAAFTLTATQTWAAATFAVRPAAAAVVTSLIPPILRPHYGALLQL